VRSDAGWARVSRMEGALIVVDVQIGLNDTSHWGHRNNLDCEANIVRLMEAWREAGQPIVRVIHHSTDTRSPLRDDHPGHELKPEVLGVVDLDLHKSVHSAFQGDPDLHAWLAGRGVEGIAVCGITTSMCCETTARAGSDLGYDLWFVLDATHGFDLADPDGVRITADQLSRSTAAVLAAEFGAVIDTEMACSLVSVASDG